MGETLITVIDAAKVMGVSPMTLMYGLRQGLYPFGNATETRKGRYRYIIFRSRFEKYLAGDDMSINVHHIICEKKIVPMEPSAPSDGGIPTKTDFTEYINLQLESAYKETMRKVEEENDNKERAMTEGQKLKIALKVSGQYYTTDDWVNILGYGIDPTYFLRRGYLKGFKPDGRQWVFKIDDFDSMDPSHLPSKMRKRFEKYLRNKGKLPLGAEK